MSSQVLGRDIDEIREKVERIKEKKNNESEGVKLARQSVEQCYLYVRVGVCSVTDYTIPARTRTSRWIAGNKSRRSRQRSQSSSRSVLCLFSRVNA